MAKVIAHFAHKQGEENCGSKMYSASIEAEVEGEDPETLKAALRRLYSLVRASVDEQLAVSGQPASTPTSRIGQASSQQAPNGNGNGGTRRIPSTPAQRKAVYAICKSQGIDPAQYPVENLSVREASELIDRLKSQQAGR